MKYKLIVLVVLFKCYDISKSQNLQPSRTMDIYLKDFKPIKPMIKMQERASNGCQNDNTKKTTPSYPAYSILPKYDPSFSLPYPMVATTKNPLHILTPYVVDKPSKDVYPKKYPSSYFASKEEDDDGDAEEDDDEYEDYEEDDGSRESGNKKSGSDSNTKFDPEKYMDYIKKNCGMCLKAERKIRRRSDDIRNIDDKEVLKKGNESQADMELARDGFYKKYKKGSDTNGYSSKLHKDELFKDHIYYDS